MAEVVPFPGLRFKSLPLTEVIAPPYDVISAEEQDRLYARSPYNVIRLELGREADRYAEAKRSFLAWRQQGILQADEPSLYLYEQRFRLPTDSSGGQGPGARGQGLFIRRAILARVRLEEWSAGIILPHEETLTKPKADRLQLMRALHANVSPVFGLYEDEERTLAEILQPYFERTPDAEGTDDAGEEHRLWRVAASALGPMLSAFFACRRLFIADGHHRYETALALRDEAHGKTAVGASAVDYVLMALVDFSDSGLVVLPTHRLFHDLPASKMRRLAEGLGDYFEVMAAAEQPTPRAISAALEQMQSLKAPAFGLYGPLTSGLRTIALKPEYRGQRFDASHSDAWNNLDVAILHAVIGERILQLDADDLASERYVSYTRSAESAIRQVQNGESQVALLVRGTPPSAIRDVALAHDKMPQKSTYFYPKLATGVVINPLD